MAILSLMTQVKFRGVIPRAHFPRNFGGIWFSSISEGFNLFTGLLHPLAMTGVVAVAHMGAGQAARGEDDAAKTSSARRTLLIIAVLVAALAPWRQAIGG